MKKLHMYKNLVVSIICALIIICGFGTHITSILYEVCVHSYYVLTRRYTVEECTGKIEDSITNGLTYHDTLVELNSILLRYSGTSYVVKDDSTIVKMENGFLAEKKPYMTDDEINEGVDKIHELYEFSKDNGAEFLYVMCPVKGYSSVFPDGIDNFIQSDCDRFRDALKSKEIPALILQDELEKEGISEEEAFFITDHHWKPTVGFWAFGKICYALNSLYGFEYNTDYTDISNYDIKTYEQWFLGSFGKKVGSHFTELGVDDIDLITPKFETSLTEEQPLKGEIRSGDFIDTVLFMDHMKNKDFYGKNPYATYSGGDFRLQIFTNHFNDNGKKILLLRDSFACAVAPFLALEADTVYLTDVRNFNWFFGEKQNVYNLIEEYNPDYVIVIYTDAITHQSFGRLDFD